jgi:hypothetical protein
MFNNNITGKPHYLSKALGLLIPKGNTFSIKNDDYSTFEWDANNVVTKPTEAEIAAKAEELRLAGEYILPRKQAYPSIEDQLDDIFHNGIDGWKATIQAVKDANPKPV